MAESTEETESFLPNGSASAVNGSDVTSDDDESSLLPSDESEQNTRVNSNFGTIMHIIKGNMGTGILAMPIAFSNAGILVGTVGLVLLGIICIHCMHVLVKCSHYLCEKFDKPHLDYADVAEYSCSAGPGWLSRHSRKARYMVNIFLFITQFGFCCVYVLFIAQNVQLAVQKFMNVPLGEPGHADEPMKLQLFELCLVGLLIPFVFIKDVKVLNPFSALANFATFIGLIIILYYIWFHEEFQSVSRLPWFNGWKKLPLYFGTAIYAFEGIGVILPMENAMKEPKALPSMFGVLNLSMTIVCVLYITIGFYGYIEFGDNSQGSVTLNLQSWFGIVVQLLFSFSIFVTYLVQFYVPLNIMGPSLEASRLAKKIGPRVLNYIVRALLVVVTFAIAAVVDKYLDLLIALIGSVASAALALIFPSLFEIITFWPDRHNVKHFRAMFIKDVCIMTFGLICFVSGTIIALEQLIVKLSGKT